PLLPQRLAFRSFTETTRCFPGACHALALHAAGSPLDAQVVALEPVPITARRDRLGGAAVVLSDSHDLEVCWVHADFVAAQVVDREAIRDRRNKFRVDH